MNAEASRKRLQLPVVHQATTRPFPMQQTVRASSITDMTELPPITILTSTPTKANQKRMGYMYSYQRSDVFSQGIMATHMPMSSLTPDRVEKSNDSLDDSHEAMPHKIERSCSEVLESDEEVQLKKPKLRIQTDKTKFRHILKIQTKPFPDANNKRKEMLKSLKQIQIQSTKMMKLPTRTEHQKFRQLEKEVAEYCNSHSFFNCEIKDNV